MPVGAAECLTADRGKPNVFNASGRVWRMWRLNTTGVLLRSSDLKAFATDRKAANFKKWEDQEPFRIRTAVLIMMKAGWMISVPNSAGTMNRIRVRTIEIVKACRR